MIPTVAVHAERRAASRIPAMRFGRQDGLAAGLGAVIHHPVFLFLSATAVAFVILFARSPAAYVYPTMLAEDGGWASLLMRRGLWHAVLNARQDYFVAGNIFLLWVGMRLCDLLYGGDPLQLPRCFALVSYLFLAAAFSLPVLILRKRLPPVFIFLLWLLACLLPMGTASGYPSGFEIIGRIHNNGYVCIFIAFILVWYRNTDASSRISFLLTDCCLCACVTTNPMCLAIAPAAAWPLARELVARRMSLRALARSSSLHGLIPLALICALTAHRVTSGPPRDPSPAMPTEAAIEVGIARNVLYPVVWPFYTSLNTDRTLLVLGIVAFGIARYGHRSRRGIYLSAALVLAATSLALVHLRRELGQCMHDYASTWPDRYFYGQNLLGLLVVVVFAADQATQLRARPRLAWLPAAALAGLAALAAYREPIWPLPAAQFMLNESFADRAADAVRAGAFVDVNDQPAPDGDFVKIAIHPDGWHMTLPRRGVEKSLDAARRMQDRLRRRHAAADAEGGVAVPVNAIF